MGGRFFVDTNIFVLTFDHDTRSIADLCKAKARVV